MIKNKSFLSFLFLSFFSTNVFASLNGEKSSFSSKEINQTTIPDTKEDILKTIEDKKKNNLENQEDKQNIETNEENKSKPLNDEETINKTTLEVLNFDLSFYSNLLKSKPVFLNNTTLSKLQPDGENPNIILDSHNETKKIVEKHLNSQEAQNELKGQSSSLSTSKNLANSVGKSLKGQITALSVENSAEKNRVREAQKYSYIDNVDLIGIKLTSTQYLQLFYREIGQVSFHQIARPLSIEKKTKLKEALLKRMNVLLQAGIVSASMTVLDVLDQLQASGNISLTKEEMNKFIRTDDIVRLYAIYTVAKENDFGANKIVSEKIFKKEKLSVANETHENYESYKQRFGSENQTFTELKDVLISPKFNNLPTSAWLKQDVEDRKQYAMVGVDLKEETDKFYTGLFDKTMITGKLKQKYENDFYQIQAKNILNNYRIPPKAIKLRYEDVYNKMEKQFGYDVYSRFTETSCVNLNLSNDFLNNPNFSKIHGKLFPELKFGKFTLKQNKFADPSKTIITPAFDVILKRLKSLQDVKINNENVFKQNMFVLEVSSDVVLKAMLDSAKHKKTREQNNLQYYHLELLSSLALRLSPDDVKDFIQASRYLISYNSKVCVY